jgi:hypothetical protein
MEKVRIHILAVKLLNTIVDRKKKNVTAVMVFADLQMDVNVMIARNFELTLKD